ncbi:MAG: DUF885 domain-containing protein, partial [Pseudomonadales bacterium]|nr:DUF885 domain-containing protein [Pseudomonadales bacterium]
MRITGLSLVVILSIPFCYGDVTTERSESAKLHEIFDRHWNREMRENPVWASMLGDRRFNTEWGDLSPAARQRRREGDMQALQDLRTVDRELLPPDEQVNYDLFERRYRVQVEGWQYETFLMPIDQRGGIQTLDETDDSLRFETVDDYEDWLARLGKVDTLMAQTIGLMEEGMEKGMMPPRITMQRVPAQIEKQIVTDPSESLFFKPFAELPADFSEEQKARIRREARRVIEGTVVPAYRKLLDFFEQEYLPACRDSVAARDLPNGEAYYEFAVRRYTTTEMTPDEVHALGLREVARNRAEMLEVVKDVGFEGSLEEFFEHLRTDPKFYFEDADDLMNAYRATAKQVDPKLVELFTRLQRMPYGVRKIPDSIALDTTTAY